MENKISRRSFMKGAAAVAAATAMSGVLAGCGSVSYPYTIGEYGLSFGKPTYIAVEGTYYFTPEVTISNRSGAWVVNKQYTNVFSASAYGVPLKLSSDWFDEKDHLMLFDWGATCRPEFQTSDVDLGAKIATGEYTLDLKITLSGQSKTFCINFKNKTVVEKK